MSRKAVKWREPEVRGWHLDELTTEGPLKTQDGKDFMMVHAKLVPLFRRGKRGEPVFLRIASEDPWIGRRSKAKVRAAEKYLRSQMIDDLRSRGVVGLEGK